MAEFKSRETTTQEATAGAKFSANVYRGRIRTAQFKTPAVAAWVANDIWVICKIPKGCRILPQAQIDHEAFGATVVMDVGIRSVATGAVIDVDKYADGVDIAAAGTKLLKPPLTADWGYETLEEVELYATLLVGNPTDNAQAIATIEWVDGT